MNSHQPTQGPPMTTKFFFYGTLMTTGSRPGWMAGLAYPLGPATIRGDLYAVGYGSFPTLVNGDGVVTGQLWEAEGEECLPSLFAKLDMIEGYSPENPTGSMYLREQRELLSPEGITAWTYIWNRGVRDLIPIPDGDWRSWRDACDRGARETDRLVREHTRGGFVIREHVRRSS